MQSLPCLSLLDSELLEGKDCVLLGVPQCQHSAGCLAEVQYVPIDASVLPVCLLDSDELPEGSWVPFPAPAVLISSDLRPHL